MTANKIIILCPSHNRPEAAKAVFESWNKHNRHQSELLFIIEENDMDEYSKAVPAACLAVATKGSRGMVRPLNQFASLMAERYKAVMFMGDDHRLSFNFDGRFIRALDETTCRIIYGNDKFQGENLPTAVCIHSGVIKALGFMALPELRHLFVDNFWLALGKQIGIKYLHDVSIEHLHPAAGKGKDDVNYQAVNASDIWQHDEREFNKWIAAEGPYYLGLKIKAYYENN